MKVLRGCGCKLNWRYSAAVLVFLLCAAISWLFVGDLILQWYIVESSEYILPRPDIRAFWLAVFLLCLSAMYLLRSAPQSLYDMEALDPSPMQNILYVRSRNAVEKFSGTVLQRLGGALYVRRTGREKVTTEVVHLRNVLRVGILDKDDNLFYGQNAMDAMNATDATDVESRDDVGSAQSNEKEASVQGSSATEGIDDRISEASKEQSYEEKKQDEDAGKTVVGKDNKTDEKPFDQIGPHFLTSSGQFGAIAPGTAEANARWSKWLNDTSLDTSSKWSWYDGKFAPHLLRFVLTTKEIKDFEAKRSSIYQVEQMHRIHELEGIEGEVEWDISNSFINAYFMIMLVAHITLCKKIAQAFICTEQPTGILTLVESPAMQCWVGEHLRIVVWALFFMLLYGIGIPVFMIYKLRQVFSDKREFDPKMRARYGYLYFKYKHEHYLWEPLAVLPRKFFVAVFRMFTRQPKYHLIQVSFTFVVMAACLALQVKNKPYIEDFLNDMETAALMNHVFVLFLATMFLSGALGDGEVTSLTSNIGYNSSQNVSIFAFTVMASVFLTMLYLMHGVLKELWEMGLLQMGKEGLQHFVLQQHAKSQQWLRRTARSHWLFRIIFGNCCQSQAAKRRGMQDGDDEADLESHDDEHNDESPSSSKKRKHKAPVIKTEAELLEEAKKRAQENARHFPPPPPRYEPPELGGNDWLCPHCHFKNLERANNAYAVVCANCGKRRVEKVQNACLSSREEEIDGS